MVNCSAQFSKSIRSQNNYRIQSWVIDEINNLINNDLGFSCALFTEERELRSAKCFLYCIDLMLVWFCAIFHLGLSFHRVFSGIEFEDSLIRLVSIRSSLITLYIYLPHSGQ